MKTRHIILAGMLLLIFTAIQAIAADNPAGVYTFNKNISARWNSEGIKYTLTIERDGQAELVIERNGKIQVNKRNIDEFGTIIERLDNDKRIVQTGRWSQYKDRVTIDLRNMNVGRRTIRLESQLTGKIKGNIYQIDRYNRNLYGKDTSFRFELIRRDDRDRRDHRNDLNNKSIASTYFFVKKANDRYSSGSIRYILLLNRDGSAKLISELQGRIDQRPENVRAHGEIIQKLHKNNRLSHSGTWEVRGDKITIDLREITAGVKGVRDERYSCRMTGTISGKTIRISNFDTKLYGRTTEFILSRT